MPKLWLVEIHEDDFEYDSFESGIVWAETAEEAEQVIRAEAKDLRSGDMGLPRGEATRLTARPAPESGVVHYCVHPG